MNAAENQSAPAPAVEITTPTNEPDELQKFRNLLLQLRESLTEADILERDGGTDRRTNAPLFYNYVEWETVAALLDEFCPLWTHDVTRVTPLGDLVAITVAITIEGITRAGVGTGSLKTETGIKKAEHDALKRAALKFGLARDLDGVWAEHQKLNEQIIEATGRMGNKETLKAKMRARFETDDLALITLAQKRGILAGLYEVASKHNLKVV